MMQKEWIFAPPAPAEHLRHYVEISPTLAQVLYNRGLEDPDSAREFVHRRDMTDDPFELKDMDIAVDRINAAIAGQEPIAVYGDFDADGVCSTALLTEVLGTLGGIVEPYIPDRAGEGYGLNTPALQALARDGIKLVVTVDCGIRSVAEVLAGKRAGLDIIVTDHHSIGPELPSALAVINPRREDCPGEARMAGVGVAFMLAKALLLHRWRNDQDNYPASLRESDLLDLVALGTVADVVNLNAGLNRWLVRQGLQTINEMRRPGIAALAKVARLRAGAIKSSHIGFGLGPRVNAAGRLGSAMIAFRLLSATSLEEAMPFAIELQTLNSRRQEMTRAALAAVSEQVEDGDTVPLIFAGDENLSPGIVGLVAGRLAETFYRPTVVLEYGEESSRASCRSIPEFDITRALDECADLLLRHGGHAMAAGFTVLNKNIDFLRQALLRKAQDSLAGRTLRPQLQLDCELDLSAVNESLIAELELLEPTGHGNPPAAFLTRNLNVVSCRRVGDEGQHLKLRIAQNGSAAMDAIGFGLGDWAKRMPRHIDAAYRAEINEWNGRRSLQLQLLDIRASLPG